MIVLCSYNKPEILYNCDTLARPILHDTILQLAIERAVMPAASLKPQSEPNFLLDGDEGFSNCNGDVADDYSKESINVSLQVLILILQYLQKFCRR